MLKGQGETETQQAADATCFLERSLPSVKFKRTEFATIGPILVAAVSIRFSKVFEQVAMAAWRSSKGSAPSGKGQRPRSLEELIRARDAAGDRVAIGLGVGLAFCAVALPVYAIQTGGHASLQPVLPQTVANIPVNKSLAKGRLQYSHLDPAVTGTLPKPAETVERTSRAPAAGKPAEKKTPFRHYVVWRVTGGLALIEGADGLRVVAPGMSLPGVGQVLSIEQGEQGWVVVTSETIIRQPVL